MTGKRKTNLNHGVVRSKDTPDSKRETDPFRVPARAEDQLGALNGLLEISSLILEVSLGNC